MKASNVTDLLFNNLSFRADRQNVISSNIANINTPHYKTKDLVFKDELNKVNKEKDLQLYTTNVNHIQASQNNNKNGKFEVVDVKGLPEQTDGNNVNLDTQISEMSKNKVMFDALQSSVKKDATWFKSIIESSQKN